MGFLMGVLGWPPQAAWAATPREVAMAIAGRMGRAQRQAMDGVGLAALMQAYPDTPPPADAGDRADG